MTAWSHFRTTISAIEAKARGWLRRRAHRQRSAPPRNYIEPTHDSLIREWGRVQKWSEQDDALVLQRAITDASRANRAGFGSRWNAEKRLGLALLRLSREPLWLSEPEREFVVRSWNLRFQLTGLAALVIAAFLVGILLALYTATRNLRLSQARELAARAEALQSDGPDRLPQSTLVAVESLRLSPTRDARRVLADNVTRMPALVHTFVHAGPVREIAVTSDGKWLVSASDDRTVCFWDTETKQEARPPLLHRFGVRLLRMTADAGIILTVSGRGIVTLWRKQPDGTYRDSVVQGQTLNEEQNNYITDGAFSPQGDFVIWADIDGIKLYDLRANRRVPFPVNWRGSQVRFSRDGTRLMTSAMGSVEIWKDWRTPNPVREYQVGSEVEVNGAQIDDDFRDVVVSGMSSGRGGAQAIPVNSFPGESPLDLITGSMFAGKVAISNTMIWGGSIAAAESVYPGKPSELILWDIGNRLRGQSLSLGMLNRLRFVPNPRVPDQLLLLAACQDHTARVYAVDADDNLQVRATEMAYITNEQPINDIVAIPNASLVATAGQDGTLQLWAVEFRLNPATLPANESIVSARVRSGAGDNCELLLVGERSQSAYTIDSHFPDTLSITRSLVGDVTHGNGILSPSGNHRIWPLVEGVAVQAIPRDTVPAPGAEISLTMTPRVVRAGESVGGTVSDAIAISANDRFVAAVSSAGTTSQERFLIGWSLLPQSPPVERFRLPVPPSKSGNPRVVQIAIHNSGALVAAVREYRFTTPEQGTKTMPESSVLLWQIDPGGDFPIVRLPDIASESHASILAVQFSPAENMLALGDDSGVLVLWRIDSRGMNTVATREWSKRFPRAVRALAFDATGERLACASADGRIHVFERRKQNRWAIVELLLGRKTAVSSNWDEILTYKSRRDVSQIAFDARGRFLVTVESGGAFLYGLRDSDLLAAAQERGLRTLNQVQWDAYVPNQPWRATFPNERGR